MSSTKHPYDALTHNQHLTTQNAERSCRKGGRWAQCEELEQGGFVAEWRSMWDRAWTKAHGAKRNPALQRDLDMVSARALSEVVDLMGRAKAGDLDFGPGSDVDAMTISREHVYELRHPFRDEDTEVLLQQIRLYFTEPLREDETMLTLHVTLKPMDDTATKQQNYDVYEAACRLCHRYDYKTNGEKVGDNCP